MEHRVSYTVIGAFVIILGGMLVAGLLWLASGGWTQSYSQYVIYLKSGAELIGKSSNVFYHGVPVGGVDSISLDHKNPEYARVVLNIDAGTPIKKDTRATVTSRGVTGVGYVKLTGGAPTSPLLMPVAGEKYPVIKVLPGAGQSVEDTVSEVAKKLEELTERLDKLLDKKNTKAVSNLLANLQELTGTLASHRAEIARSVVDLQKTLSATRKASRRLPQLMHEIDLSLGSIRVTAAQIGTAARSVSTMTTGVDSLKPQMQLLLERLRRSVQDLDTLLQSLNRQPNALLFGKPVQPGPGETRHSKG